MHNIRAKRAGIFPLIAQIRVFDKHAIDLRDGSNLPHVLHHRLHQRNMPPVHGHSANLARFLADARQGACLVGRNARRLFHDAGEPRAQAILRRTEQTIGLHQHKHAIQRFAFKHFVHVPISGRDAILLRRGLRFLQSQIAHCNQGGIFNFRQAGQVNSVGNATGTDYGHARFPLFHCPHSLYRPFT